MRTITISYQNRSGKWSDIPPVSKIVLANNSLRDICGFKVSDKVTVEYLSGKIIITKI